MHWLFPLLAFAASATGAIVWPFPPRAGEPGSTAVSADDDRIVGWASGVADYSPGNVDISVPSSPLASWGVDEDTGEVLTPLGPANAHTTNGADAVSLGDRGSITLTFDAPFGDGPGPDLAVFENGFRDEWFEAGDFLELAFVEVSSDGQNFHRFASISMTQTSTQITTLGTIDPQNIHNLAGKYVRGFGTPFDLAELAGIETLDIFAITHVRIVDVVGSINSAHGSLDSRDVLINDPWKTNFETGGFDLDAIAILNVPEPAAALLLGIGGCFGAARRRRGP